MKGIPKHCVMSLDFEDYKEAVFNPMVQDVEFRGMRMHVNFQKIFVTSFNDKVFMLEDLTCRPMGHWRNKPVSPVLLDELD